MRKKDFLFLLGIGASIVTVNASTIKISVTNQDASEKVVLTFANKEKKEITLDAAGKASVTLTDFEPQYVKLQYGRASRLLYLDPSQDLSMSFDGESMWKAISFTGAGASVNTYLNNGKLKQLAFNDAKVEEKAYIQKSDSLYQANLNVLEVAGLPDGFVKQEKERLKFYSYAGFPLYPIYYAYLNKTENFKATEAYYSHLKNLTVIDADLLLLKEYKEFLFNAVSCLGLNGEKNESQLQLLQAQLKYIEENVTEEKVREYLVNTVAYNFVKSNGIDEAAPAIEAFNKYVKDSEMTSKFNAVCDSWRKLSSGKPSPVFSGETTDGKTVTLSDLKGKYIYIDVWATWCGPCRGELPHLKELEEKYRGKEIEFVSLSCDQNKGAWKKMVEKEQMKGVQLYIGAKSEFMQDYMINGIPRFILLDKEGNIISANMSRPSQPETVVKLDALLK